MKTQKTNHSQQDELTLLRAENAHMAEQLASLQHQVDWFKRQIFGRKSERQLEDNPFQSALFQSDKKEETETVTTEVKSHRRSSKKTLSGDEVNDSGLRFDESVPQQVIEVSVPELEGMDAERYEIIDYKETVRLAQQPGSYCVLIYRRPVVRIKKEQRLVTPAAPANVLEGCYADVSLLAGMMVDKAVYHLPIYRQHQRLGDAGIILSRATLVNWIKKAIELLRPIYEAQRYHILQSRVLAMDEVPIKAGRKSKGKMKQTYYWPMFGEADEVAFTWSPSRGHRHALEQLSDFEGVLLTDGYQAYNTLAKKLNEKEEVLEQAHCWAHSRRQFEKALKMEPEAAQQALAWIGALYKVEKHLRAQLWEAAEVLAYRQEHSEPIYHEFFEWVYEQRQRVDLTPSNPLSKALEYVSKRQLTLKVFLSNPYVPIDTNHLERALRVIPMGRKNYLFCWSELGAEHMGILQSLMVTCRLQGVHPYTYLVDVLQRVSLHPAKEVIDLTPRVWKEKFADNFFTSDLDHKG